jgi:molybdate transport system permease protein
MRKRTMLRIGWTWWLLSLPLLGFLTLPLLALLVQDEPSVIVSNLFRPPVYRAIGLSLKTSLVTLAFTVVLGTPLALILARRDFPMRRVVDTLIDLPMVLPPAVAGIALLIVFGRSGLIGQHLAAFGIQIPFTQAAVVMAQAFVAAPLFIRSAIIGIDRIDEELEEAALLDGATTWQVVRYVTLPSARPACLGGAVLTWARALGEFGATIIFAGNLPGRTQTMPLAIYLGFELDMSVAIALSVILMGASFLVLALLRYLLKG